MPRALRFAAMVLVLLTLLGGCSPAGPSPTADPAAAATLLGVAWNDRSPFRAGLVPTSQGVLEQLRGASVYQIDLQIPAALDTLAGRQSVRYTNQEGVPLQAVYFQLFPNIAGGRTTVAAARVDGQAVTPAYEYGDSTMRLDLPAVLQPGDQAVIELEYTLEIPREMGGNYGLYGYFEGLLVLDRFYPVVPVYDGAGWNVQAPPPNGDLTYYDMSFYLVRVTAPAGLVLVASGVEAGRVEAGGEQVVTYAAGPMRDFYLAAGEGLEQVSTTVGPTTVRSYADRARREGAQRALETAARALAGFSKRFGAYPYSEFDLVSTPMRALGIEYPGMTGIALNLYEADAEVLGAPAAVVLESTVAHEVGHQWFYNLVGNDEVDAPWLDESLVQYITGLYYRDAYGTSAEASYRASWDSRWARIDRAAIPIGRPSGSYAANEYSPVIYGRGPYFFAALEEELGPGRMEDFLRNYFQTNQWGLGTSTALRDAAERQCGCDLGELFAGWVDE